MRAMRTRWSHFARGLLPAVGVALAVQSASAGQAPVPPPSATARTSPQRVGVQGFATFGLTRQLAADSFTSVDLSTQSPEIGGGGQITNLWRTLFVQGSIGRWSSTGERVFIDSGGTRYPLGIRLSVEATNIEVSAGWRFEPQASRGTASRLVPYIGGGAGVVRYVESSPFAQVGDDLDAQYTSYHALGGLEVGIARWIALAADARYRVVPGVLGEGGVSVTSSPI
jgi:opacity protein-like surface antigen